MNTRRTQPYRKRPAREKGPTLRAMVKGRPMFLGNPQDIRRAALRRRRRRRRPAR